MVSKSLASFTVGREAGREPRGPAAPAAWSQAAFLALRSVTVENQHALSVFTSFSEDLAMIFVYLFTFKLKSNTHRRGHPANLAPSELPKQHPGSTVKVKENPWPWRAPPSPHPSPQA